MLAHCLAILKDISKEESSLFKEDELLRQWCESQSQHFNDEKFNELFYEQMSSAAKKLNSFSEKQEKNFKELNFEDLIILVKQNSWNYDYVIPKKKYIFVEFLTIQGNKI